jgi:hypothetical protein
MQANKRRGWQSDNNIADELMQCMEIMQDNQSTVP